MKTYPKLYLLLLVCIAPLLNFAQNSQLEKADKKFEQYAFIDAQKIYLKIAEEGFESAELFQKLGDSYYFNGLYEDGSQWYEKLITQFPEETTPEYFFRYAQTLKALKEYKKSDEIMLQFRELKGEDSRVALFEDKRDYLEDISYIDSDYEVENLRRINSKYSDFGATLYKNKLIFASSRDTGTFSKKRHKWNNQPFLDLYAATIDEETGNLYNVERFGGKLNSPFHESSPIFSRDGNTIYFTRNNYSQGSKKKDENGTTRLKIYKAEQQGADWTPAVELPFNDNSYSVAHPALSPDETKLYFASDMPGTVGLSDIWYVDLHADGSYGEPTNMGPMINTEGRENFPFISKDGSLYFSSDGRPGLGGLDIYVAAKDSKGKIVQIINLGEPVNSNKDDFSFIVDDQTNTGYFSTNRYFGMGSDDIFSFSKKPKEEPLCYSLVKGVVKDKETLNPIPEASVSLLDLDGNTIEKVVADKQGNFRLNPLCNEEYIVRAEKQDYTSAEELITSPLEGNSLSLELLLERRIQRVKEGDDLAKLLKLNPIYFDFDRFNIRQDAALELTKVLAVLEENPTMIIDVRSHTDSQGNDSYNLALSEKRAQATVDYIVNKGIPRNRITGKGYGETQLINNCGSGIKCSDEEQQLNRRSEFIVLQTKLETN